MRNVSWPLAVMVSVAMLVIGAAALLDRDIAAVSAAITTILIALGLAELREIKTQTNGNNTSLLDQNRALMAEIAQYRRDALNITNRALDSAPLPQPPNSTTTTTTSTSSNAPNTVSAPDPYAPNQPYGGS